MLSSFNQIILQSNSWQGLKASLDPLDSKTKGDFFEQLTKYLLQLLPTYQTSLKNVWLLDEVPTAVRDHINLPNTDEGIDLIAETFNGRYWAIQCKYHADERHSITRRELSTFTDLAFNICKNIELALVCTNAEHYSRKLKMHGDKISFCAGEVWRSLDTDFFQRLHSFVQGKKTQLKPYEPRDHQKSAINNAVSHYIKEDNERGKLILPCGTGKSLVGYWIAMECKAKSIIVAVPSINLIRQTLEVWLREAVANNQSFNWIAVCSDESVGKSNSDEISFFSHDLGIKVHTDPEEIAGWLINDSRDMTVVFTTYQSGRAISEATKQSGITFDIGIFDEAHKTVGKSDSLFSHLLFDENIDINKRIFMTATERVYRGKSDQIASMDDYDVYGDTFELLSFKEALESKPPILSDYKIITVAVTKNEIQHLIEENLYVKPDKGAWNEEVEAEMLTSAVALRKAIQKYPIKHTVSFHRSIARAKAFQNTHDVLNQALPEYKSIETFHVTGKTPSSERSKEMDRFASAEMSLITNARCLTEGVDIPNIDCVLFADPKKSTIDIVQAVGRALRTAPNKDYGYVIIPVLIDQNEFDITVLENNAYESVLVILRALASNDDRIVEYFRSISQGNTRKGDRVHIEIDVPLGLKIDTDEFVNAVDIRVWSRLAKLSWQPFEEARDFAHKLNLNSRTEWRKYCKGGFPDLPPKPDDIPTDPYQTYRGRGWKSDGDWLGTGAIATRARTYLPFNDARDFVHKLNLKSRKEWSKYCKGGFANLAPKPDDIPASPEKTYNDKGWKGVGDWLGTGIIATYNIKYRPFKEARDFAHKLNLKNRAEWSKYCKGGFAHLAPKPDDIPVSPEKTYNDKGWKGVGDWLGTGAIASSKMVYRSFAEARDFAHKLNLKSNKEWRRYCKGGFPDLPPKPDDISANPNQTYRGRGWQGFGDWLGTGIIATRYMVYRSFAEARDFVHKLHLKSSAEWSKYCKGGFQALPPKPENIPAAPSSTYKNKGWKGYGDWLGTGTIAQKDMVYLPFNDARDFVHKLKFKNRAEWSKYCKGGFPDLPPKPDDIPASPERTYKNKGWKGVGDWLGTGTIAQKNRTYLPFNDARDFVHKLNLKSRKEWSKYCKGGFPDLPSKPYDIPSGPDSIYKNKGWHGIGDWLGIADIFPYLSFKEAREFVHRLKLKNGAEWKKYCKGGFPELPQKPDDIPTRPERTYKNKGWKGVGDWLGYKKS